MVIVCFVDLFTAFIYYLCHEFWSKGIKKLQNGVNNWASLFTSAKSTQINTKLLQI